MSLNRAIENSKLSTIGKAIENTDNSIQWLIQNFAGFLNEKKTNKISYIMPFTLIIANGITLIVVVIAAIDYYLSYLVSWIPGFDWTPMTWLHDRLGNSFKNLLLILIGLLKLIITIIMIIACIIIFFETYHTNNVFIRARGFDFLIVITQVFLKLIPFIFLSLTLMIGIGFLTVYYKKFCTADGERFDSDSRNTVDKIIHKSVYITMFTLLVLSIAFPILQIMKTKPIFRSLRPHIPPKIKMQDNFKLLFVAFLSFITFTFVTDSISSFIEKIFERQLAGETNQEYCDPNDPRNPENQQDAGGFDKAIGYIKEALNGFLFIPFILIISIIQTGCGPGLFNMNMSLFLFQRNIINHLIKSIFEADAEGAYKKIFMDLKHEDGKGPQANQVNVGDKIAKLPSQMDRAIAIDKDNAYPPTPAEPKYLKTPRAVMSKVARKLGVRNLSEKERYDDAKIEARKYINRNDPEGIYRNERAAIKLQTTARRRALRRRRRAALNVAHLQAALNAAKARGATWEVAELLQQLIVMTPPASHIPVLRDTIRWADENLVDERAMAAVRAALDRAEAAQS